LYRKMGLGVHLNKMSKILKKFEELEIEIKHSNEYQRCPDFCNGCIQCDFWKKFDYLKGKFVKNVNNEVKNGI